MDPLSYDTPGELHLQLRLGSGDVRVRTADVDRTTLHVTGERGPDDVTVVFEPGDDGHHRLTVEQRAKGRTGWRAHGLSVEVTAPVRTHVRLEGGSADLRAQGPLLSAAFSSGSGDAYLENVRDDVEVKVASGNLRLRSVGGSVTFHSASGDLIADTVRKGIVARTASGDVSVGSADGDLRITTVSGDVRLDNVSRGSAEIQAVSGDITLGAAVGTHLFLDLSSMSGKTSSDLPVSDSPPVADALQLDVRARTVSGDIHIRRGSARHDAA